jgi:DNA-binding protein YbaB
MPEPLGDEELERLMLDTRATIDQLRTEKVLPGDVPAEGHGEASEGRVRVTARAGQIESITLEPRLLRLPPEEAGELVRDAANAALTDVNGRSAAAAPDLAAISEALREVQNEGLRQMAIITDGIAGAMAQIRQRTRISGDPSPQGLEHLLNLTQQNLDDVVAASGEPREEPRGEGEAARGQIRVVAVVGRVESVTIEPQAMRRSSHELAEQLRTALNAALDDLRTSAGGRSSASGVNTEELSARARELQDMSLAQLRTYTRALRDIMGSIEGPE